MLKHIKDSKINNTPLVSIVIPFYKGRAFIHETLTSFLKQSYTHWECLVIDDHSPESAEDICMAFADERIRYIRNDGPSGMAHARNKGVSLAKGEFIAMSDQDDISLPERLSRQVEMLQNDDALLLLGTWRRNFGLNKHKQYYPTDPDRIKMGLLKNMNLINKCYCYTGYMSNRPQFKRRLRCISVQMR